jgi:hypothetical protein
MIIGRQRRKILEQLKGPSLALFRMELVPNIFSFPTTAVSGPP